MAYDHKAIYKSHSNVIRIEDGGNCYDASGNVVTLNQSNIDAARVELDKTKYKTDRVSYASTVHYPDFANKSNGYMLTNFEDSHPHFTNFHIWERSKKVKSAVSSRASSRSTSSTTTNLIRLRITFTESVEPVVPVKRAPL